MSADPDPKTGATEPYLFQGIVLPERAQLSLEFGHEFKHIISQVSGTVKVSIILNQVAVWIHSSHEWDIFDLRNVAQRVVKNHLAIVGYIRGYAYDLELTRVLHQGLGIDYVYGIDIPEIGERNKAVDLNEVMTKIVSKTFGEAGVFLHRCFDDLSSAMKNADDTGFYCYRAIESLRHHCAATQDLSEAPKKDQWDKFREIANCDRAKLQFIKEAADPLRHGGISQAATVDERVRLFLDTWDIVGAYLDAI